MDHRWFSMIEQLTNIRKSKRMWHRHWQRLVIGF